MIIQQVYMDTLEALKTLWQASLSYGNLETTSWKMKSMFLDLACFLFSVTT